MFAHLCVIVRYSLCISLRIVRMTETTIKPLRIVASYVRLLSGIKMAKHKYIVPNKGRSPK